jgi:hypothetical protein
MKSVLCIVVSMILAALAVAMVWLLLRPPNPRPSFGVTVNVLGITNDASGARQASFRVSNTGGHRVTIAPSFVLENHSGQWHTNLLPVGAITSRTNLMGILPFHPRGKVMAPQEAFEVTLPLPFDDQTWRASFCYLEIRPPLEAELYALFRRIGIKSAQDGFIWASVNWRAQ